MAERRIRQYAVCNGILDDLLAQVEQTHGGIDALLKARGLVPVSASLSHVFAVLRQDISVFRYKDASFPVVDECGSLEPVMVSRAQLGIA